MDVLTISLMLAAGLLHASWHSLVKSGQNQITVLAGMGTVAGLWAVAALPFVPFPAAEIWPVLLLSVGLHIAYKLCLAGAYTRGDFGQAFPLARGMVPLFATLIAFIGLDQLPSINQCVGIVMVSSGLLLLSLEKIHRLAQWPLLLTAAAAGAAVAFYSTVDAYGTRPDGQLAWLHGLAHRARQFCLPVAEQDLAGSRSMERIQHGPMARRRFRNSGPAVVLRVPAGPKSQSCRSSHHDPGNQRFVRHGNRRYFASRTAIVAAD
ncbi:putative membrane protein [Bradyrhizobium liaoningense]